MPTQQLSEPLNPALTDPSMTADMPAPELTPDQRDEQRAKDELFIFREAKPYLTELADGFKGEVTLTQANRDRRLVDIDLKAERDAKRIKQSDVLTPMRVIDENIAREKPAYINYLQNSRRLAIFSDRLQPNNKYDELEGAFTRGMQYDNWIVTYHKVVDGMQLHGWDWAEVLYDADKPLHVGVEHVGHDRLEFSLDAEDIQNNIRVSRVYKWTRTQLDTAARDFGFSKDQVSKLKNYQSQKDTKSAGVKDQVFTVKKGYFKFENCVYVCWYNLDVCDDWLLEPRKFFNGVSKLETVMVEQPPQLIEDGLGNVVPFTPPPVPTQQWVDAEEYLYPIVLYAYEETEQKEVSCRKGRAFKDKFKQEVMTTGWSCFLNGQNRSTWVMAARNQSTGRSAAEIQTVEFSDGAILNEPVNFVNMPAPNPAMLQGLQLFDTKISQGIGQMTYAVQNKSSGARTTATEIESAQQDTALQSSVNVTLYSASLRRTMINAWRIVQSQALQNKINFYGDYVEIPSATVPGEVEMEFQNNVNVIKKDFDLRPAGDVDVIQRQELIAGMMEFWPVVANTPIAMEFLAELLKIRFAEKGDNWAMKLLQGDVKAMLLQQYAEIIGALLANPAEAQTIGLKEQQALMALLQQTQQALTNPNGQSNSTTNQQPAGGGNGQSGAAPVAQQQANAGGN